MQFPGPVRAVVGLLANAADEAKHLPDRAIELPMLAVSTALQLSLRAQQRYARLAARGDDVLNRRSPGDEPPAWATFDEPVSLDELAARPSGDGAAEGARAASELIDSLFGLSDDASPSSNGTASAPPAKKIPAKRAAAKQAPAARKAPVEKAPVEKAPVEKAPARKAPAKKAAAKKAPAGTKSVSKPRHTPPSRFDDADDE